MNDTENDIAIVKSVHFDIIMLRPSLAVLAIPHKAIPKCAWWLLREYGRYSFEENRCKDLDISNHSNANGDSKRGFGMILYDDDGLTVISEATKLSTVRYLLKPEEFTLSPFYWKAFIISMRGRAVEVPGAVYCLANALSNEGLSILHISTFDCEVFLVQEPDLETACRILKEFEDPRVIMEILESRYVAQESLSKERHSSQSLSLSVSKDPALPSPLQEFKEEDLEEEGYDSDDKNARRDSYLQDLKSTFYDADQSNSVDAYDDMNRFNLDLSWITPQVKSTVSLPKQLSEAQRLSSLPSKTKFDEGFSLGVLPTAMIMAKCSKQDMKIFSDILIKMILYDERYNQFSSSYSKEGVAINEENNSAPIKHQTSEYFLPSEDSVDTFQSPAEVSKRFSDVPTLPPSSKEGSKKSETDRANFMYGLWYAHDEVTFLFHENDLPYFPDENLIISPQQWKVIKLCGRPIAFNETGVVSAMSQVDTNVPSLNISTAVTNCTLVPYELLQSTVEGLSSALNCPVHIKPSLSIGE